MSSAQRLFVQAASTASASGDGGAPTACPVAAGQPGPAGATPPNSSSSAAAAASACPVAADERHAARINMPVVPNAAPADAGSAAGLNTQRQASTIPIAAADGLPVHQEGASSSGTWMYPSEAQFYNAMRRKGWSPSEADMSHVVAIHNGVNEEAWRHVQTWEGLHACDCPAGPRLLRFQGRPKDYSPKARLLNLLGYKLPFDRHDWVVDRCGTQVRYVIDFYSGAPQPGAAASMHLDVRPALDSFEAAWDRLRMQWRWVSSGRWRGE